MQSAFPEKWLIYGGVILALALLAPYFSFIIRDVQPRPTITITPKQELIPKDKPLPTLDELLEQQG